MLEKELQTKDIFFNENILKEINLDNLAIFIREWFLEKGSSKENNRLLLEQIIKNKVNLSCELLFFYTGNKIFNIEKLSDEKFFKYLFDFLNKEYALNKEEINLIKLAYINKGKEKFADYVNSILSNSIKLKIGITNLQIIEGKIENKYQSEIILNFLEKNPEYIDSTVLLILGTNNINNIVELITKIINFNNIVNLTSDKFQFQMTQNNDVIVNGVLDIYNTLYLIEHVFINKLIPIINNIDIIIVIRLLNVIGHYELTMLINKIENMNNFIKYINTNNINDIINIIKDKGIIYFLKTIS